MTPKHLLKLLKLVNLQQVLSIPLDSKGQLAQELLKVQEDRMVPVQGQHVVSGPLLLPHPSLPQMVSSPTTSRPQDAIASILASMNQGHPGGEGLVGLASPVDYSQAEHVVTMVESQGEGQGAQPLNLATLQGGLGGQTIQVQGVKRLQGQGAGIVSKKVIIATINGTQRILTPVSSPQMIAVKSPQPPQPRLVTADQGPGTPLTIIQQQKPGLVQGHQVLQGHQILQGHQLHRPKLAVTSPTAVKCVDNKTCRWKFENGQICGKVFTKTYNLTVHMRMHQDIRPFPCTICEQTFRQKAHLQRHEATHGIDSTAGRKRRKRSLLEGMEGMGVGGRRMSESEEEEGEGEEEQLYRHSFPSETKRKFSVGSHTLKTEAGTELELDPMIEPIEGSGSGVQRARCPISIGTNTEGRGRERQYDELEEDMEPVRYRREQGAALQVEQGVQYCEADLLEQGQELEQQREQKFQPGSSIDAPSVAAMQTQVSMAELMGEEVGGKVMKVEGEVQAFSSQTHYVEQEQEQYLEEEELVGEDDQQQQHHLIDADGSYIDASTNQIVMSDGGLVRLVSMHQGENVVNIVTSTATNEHGQQVVIIENLEQHSPELQREIMRALLADPSIVPVSS